MHKPLALGSLLLLTTALTAPSAFAQDAAPTGSAPSAGAVPPAAEADNPEEEVEISAPGAGGDSDIVVTGRFIPEPIRATPEVISVLSSADIARTGEGDISGALSRVTGLSVVGAGFVYVRGLGDRYSLSLLNGSPLPSPEPLRRVVPLDIFPTSIVGSAVVQKSYSVNYPGEFGGGVINLTTKAVPTEPFLNIGASISGDSETTAQLGYTYYGSDLDFLGYDDGTRDTPPGLIAAGASGGNLDSQALTEFSNAKTTLLQRNTDIPANFSGEISGGTSWDLDNGRLGLIAAVGINNNWRTRDSTQQATDDIAGQVNRDFRTVITENRVIVNGLFGLGLELGEHRLRWTNLYIHDSLKQGRLGAGNDVSIASPNPGDPPLLLEQNTYLFERQLLDTQFVGEFKFGDLSADVRGTYAKTKRDSPYERSFGYIFNDTVGDYTNNLSGPSNGQTATIAFSELDERVISGGLDLAYTMPTARKFVLSAGYNYTDTERSSFRYFFRYRGEGNSQLDLATSQLRPDYLLSDFTIITNGINLQNESGALGQAAYDAKLRVHGAYGQGEMEFIDGLSATAGVRYETAKQTVITNGVATATSLDNDYWLPALTVTWNFAEDMQLRLAGSKTIARPQFRELAAQLYQDFESDRQFIGNPNLQDSELYNAEARYEYYFDRGQRLTVAGFFKRIENPIEAVATIPSGSRILTGFSNAPKADLYGGEFEIQKYVPLEGLGGDFFVTKRLVLIGNYTYTQSKLKVGDELVSNPVDASNPIAANLLFRDGAPLTGQSDHLVNVQVGIEDTESLQQATVLFTYASERVTNRGPIVAGQRLPDLVEKPGIRLDFVYRQGFELLSTDMELKFEARNLTGTGYQEFQNYGDAGKVFINRYDLGRSFSLGVTANF